MKVCFLAGLYPFSMGGAEYQAKMISENLKLYHDVFYITSIPENNERRFVHNNIRVYNVQFNPLKDQLSFYHFFLKKIKIILEKENPSVIYHRVLMPYTYWLAKYAKKRSIPFILHITSEHSITFRSAPFSAIRRILLQKTIKCGANLLVQTPEQKLKLIRYYPKSIAVIPNLVYPAQYYDPEGREKNILWIGKSSRIKQMSLFLDAAEKMRDLNVNFIIISRFLDDKTSNQLLSRIGTLTNVKNLGEKTNDFINEYLQKKAYLLVNTSLSEGFSNTFLQAWSAGVPVISLNSNPGNIFLEKEVGFYCQGKVEKIREAIMLFMADNNYYLRVSRSCYKTIDEKFAVNILLPEYRHYFESLI
jgi:glycosyltransferase involved in cell wall biosynthesis